MKLRIAKFGRVRKKNKKTKYRNCVRFLHKRKRFFLIAKKSFKFKKKSSGHKTIKNFMSKFKAILFEFVKELSFCRKITKAMVGVRGIKPRYSRVAKFDSYWSICTYTAKYSYAFSNFFFFLAQRGAVINLTYYTKMVRNFLSRGFLNYVDNILRLDKETMIPLASTKYVR